MRQLKWPNCYNTRDLGGLPTADGQSTQFGRIIRSDIPARLTADGRQMMWAYGIRTILDLRAPWQTVEEPSNISQLSDAPHLPTYINISLETYKPDENIELTSGGSRAALYCLMIDHYSEQIKHILEVIAYARDGGVLIHCHAGKDRTGIVCALLLCAAGVSQEQASLDYAQSQPNLWPLWEQIVDESGGAENANPFMKPDATIDKMVTLFSHIDKKYGGILPYLRFAGLADSTIQRLVNRLID